MCIASNLLNYQSRTQHISKPFILPFHYLFNVVEAQRRSVSGGRLPPSVWAIDGSPLTYYQFLLYNETGRTQANRRISSSSFLFRAVPVSTSVSFSHYVQ